MATGEEAVTVEQVARALGVPARRASDGAVGMYDTVGGAFLANSGSGAFKAGPEVATASVDGAEGAAVTLKQFKVAAAKNGHR